MEITLLTENELKVSLTRDDMAHYALDCASIDYDTTGTRRAFWSILDEARLQTGFDAAHDRIYIRIYPSRDGGCEMYVTKLPQGIDADGRGDVSDCADGADPVERIPGIGEMSADEDAAASADSGKTDEKKAVDRHALPEGPRTQALSPAAHGAEYALYLLDTEDVSSLIAFCVRLEKSGFSRENALYVLHPEIPRQRRFCLAVQEDTRAYLPENASDALLAEYTERMLPSSAYSALCEHAVCIAARHAVRALAALGEETHHHDKRRTAERKAGAV